MWTGHSLFIRLPAEEHSGCFQLGAIMNKATVIIHIQAFVGTYVFIFLGKSIEVKFLGHAVFLTFKKMPSCFRG